MEKQNKNGTKKKQKNDTKLYEWVEKQKIRMKVAIKIENSMKVYKIMKKEEGSREKKKCGNVKVDQPQEEEWHSVIKWGKQEQHGTEKAEGPDGICSDVI